MSNHIFKIGELVSVMPFNELYKKSNEILGDTVYRKNDGRFDYHKLCGAEGYITRIDTYYFKTNRKHGKNKMYNTYTLDINEEYFFYEFQLKSLMMKKLKML